VRRVVKLGGRVQQSGSVHEALARAWQSRPGSLCVVHGGGDEVSALQRVFGLEPKFIGGRRVTSPDDVDLVRMALSGSANKRLVVSLQRAGAPSVGLSGEDGRLLVAREAAGGALGRVGEPVMVNAAVLVALFDAGFLPVISPLGCAEDGSGPLNVNGDDAASAIAAELGAEELLLLADVEGVVAGGAVLSALDADGAATLIAAGTAAGGMAAKLEAALRALDAGVPRVRIGGVGVLTDQSSGTALTPARSLV
jgi:acetylglutamate kinase